MFLRGIVKYLGAIAYIVFYLFFIYKICIMYVLTLSDEVFEDQELAEEIIVKL